MRFWFLAFLSGFSSVTGGGIAFRMNAGLGIGPSEEVPKSDSLGRDEFPFPVLKFPRRVGDHLAALKKPSPRKAAATGRATWGLSGSRSALFWLPVLFLLVFLSEWLSATCGEIASRVCVGFATLSSKNGGAQN
jgi:hypothetical protein